MKTLSIECAAFSFRCRPSFDCFSGAPDIKAGFQTA
jgi:hypothetical protein